MKRYRLIVLLIAFVIALGIASPNNAFAKSALHIDAEIGINNRIKSEMPTVLTLTVTNNGDTFSGDLVVDAALQYNVGSALVYPIDIATGETKTFTIYLDGFSNHYMYSGQGTQDMFHFYEGGIEKGKKVDYEGKHFVSPQMFGSYAEIMMMVATTKDQVSKVDRIKLFYQDEFDLLHVDKKDSKYLSEDSRALKMLDTIWFDDIAVQDLSQKQQEALYQWVQQGGQIVFSATDFAASGAGIFKEHLPLTFTGEQVTLVQDDIKQYITAGSTEATMNVQKADVAQGGVPTLKINDTVLAAKKAVGAGNVIQVAYSIRDENITNLSGYGRLLIDSLQLSANYNYNYYTQYPFSKGSSLTYVNELFETFKINIWLLIAGITVYTILIGPVLYYILKRKDRREKMWLFVPIIAIITSLLFFVFGAKDRILKPQIQQMAIFNVSEDGTLLGAYTNALLSNRSGEFEYHFAKGTSAVAYTTNDISSTSLHLKSYLKEAADKNILNIRNMSYWSVQSIVGETTIADGGKLITDLKVENLKLTGTIKNELPVDLQELMVLSGRDEIAIGPIKAGETLNVNVDVKRPIMPQPYNYNYYSYGYGNNGNVDLIEQRKNTMKELAINTSTDHYGPILVGWSDVSLIPVELTTSSKQQTLSYFLKPFKPEVIVAGEVSFTNEDATPYLEPVDNYGWGHIEDLVANTAYIGEGTFKLVYPLSLTDDIAVLNWKELDVKYDDSMYTLGVVNTITNDVVPFENGKVTLKNNIQSYINDKHVLTFEITRIGMDNGNSIKLPTFTLKGEPKK